ncbi:hypothetical protein NYV54_25025 [Escherichia coli]|nr:hypothetical protein [Escherichia coli]MCW7039993.1 hypothetical protein [Escherichia coli]
MKNQESVLKVSVLLSVAQTVAALTVDGSAVNFGDCAGRTQGVYHCHAVFLWDFSSTTLGILIR